MKFRISTPPSGSPVLLPATILPLARCSLNSADTPPAWGLCMNLFLYLECSSYQEWLALPSLYSNGLMERPCPKFLHKITPVATLSTHPVFLIFLALNMARDLPQWLSSEESACSARDVGRSLGREDPPKEEVATHSSFLACKDPTDRGAWRATVHGVAKSCS